jgi:hypothetical protein
MTEREFIIDVFSDELEICESLDSEYAKSVCENDLEIPQSCIQKIECYDDAFKVYLTKSRKYYRDDWYVNLRRLDFVS